MPVGVVYLTDGGSEDDSTASNAQSIRWTAHKDNSKANIAV